MILNPTEEQRRQFAARRGYIEREINDDGDTYGYEMLAIDSYISEDLISYFDSLTAPGKYHMGYCDCNSGSIMAYRRIKKDGYNKVLKKGVFVLASSKE